MRTKFYTFNVNLKVSLSKIVQEKKESHRGKRTYCIMKMFEEVIYYIRSTCE